MIYLDVNPLRECRKKRKGFFRTLFFSTTYYPGGRDRQKGRLDLMSGHLAVSRNLGRRSCSFPFIRLWKFQRPFQTT